MNRLLFILLWSSYSGFSEVIDPDEFMKKGNERVSRIHSLVSDRVKRVFLEHSKPEEVMNCLINVVESGLIVCGDSVGKFTELFDNNHVRISESIIAVPTITKANSDARMNSTGPGRQWFLIVEINKDQKISSVSMVYKTIKELALMKSLGSVKAPG